MWHHCPRFSYFPPIKNPLELKTNAWSIKVTLQFHWPHSTETITVVHTNKSLFILIYTKSTRH